LKVVKDMAVPLFT